jgi:hypothetical protein
MLDKLQRGSTGFCRCGAGVYASKSGAIFRPEIALAFIPSQNKSPGGLCWCLEDALKTELCLKISMRLSNG